MRNTRQSDPPLLFLSAVSLPVRYLPVVCAFSAACPVKHAQNNNILILLSLYLYFSLFVPLTLPPSLSPLSINLCIPLPLSPHPSFYHFTHKSVTVVHIMTSSLMKALARLVPLTLIMLFSFDLAVLQFKWLFKKKKKNYTSTNAKKAKSVRERAYCYSRSGLKRGRSGDSFNVS